VQVVGEAAFLGARRFDQGIQAAAEFVALAELRLNEGNKG
jgi:hypothetical protein